MSEPDISTLARRLAEQNNVDWRALHGSGPEGKVVERDVLDYLSRVMSGSEALNPTPEPLPEGMEAWPDQDLATFRQGVSDGASSLESLRDDIKAAASVTSTGSAVVDEDAGTAVETVAFGRRDTDPGISASHHSHGTLTAEDPSDDAAATDDEMLGEDIFLFDDEAAPSVGVPEVNEAIDPVDELDDLLVAGDDDLEVAASPLAYPEADDLAVSAFEAVGTAVDFQDEEVDELVAEVQAVAQDEFGDFSVPGFAAPAYDSSDDDLPDLFGEAETAGVDELADDGESELFQADEVDAGFETDDLGISSLDAAEAADQVVEEVEEFEFDGAWTTQPEAETEATPEPVASLSFDEDAASDEDADQALTEDFAAGFDSDVAEVEDVAADAVETREIASSVALVAGALPLARPANLLRRNVDLSSLAGAQLAVSLELGNAEPLSVAPFLLRAVAKAAVETGLPQGTIALAELNGGVRLRRVDDAASRSFASLVSLLEEPFNEEDEPALAVADLGPLDLDEVILDLDVPVVSLGRVLYDTQRGGYRSTLALSGSLAPDSGARLLARVAELLDAPVRLVL